MNILITGFPDTGKTAIAHELKRRGYYAYDPESMRSYMHLQSRETGRHIRKPEIMERGWYDTVGEFDWDTVRLSQILQSKDHDIFVCSLARNMETLSGAFAKKFVLTLDSIELEARLNARNDDIINRPLFVADTLSHYQDFVNHMRSAGAIEISVKPSIKEVVDRILNETYREM